MSFAVKHPIIALLAWVVLLLAIVGGVKALPSQYNDSLELPGVQSTTAQNLLETIGKKKKATDTSTVKIVWSPKDGTVEDKAAKEKAIALMKETAKLPYVTCVVGPFGENYGKTCPKAEPVDVKKTIDDLVMKTIAEKTGLSEAQLEHYMTLLPEIYPIAEWSPERLSAIATALPGVAKLARMPKEDLALINSIHPAALKRFGVTQAEAAQMSGAIGGLDKIASLPPSVLSYLAAADPQKLAANVSAIPGKVQELKKGIETIQADVKKYTSAAEAAKKDTSQVSTDKKIAYATVTFDTDSPLLLPEVGEKFLTFILPYDKDEFTVGTNGSSLDSASTGPDASQGIGLLFAFLILLIAFGSLIAAGLPIVVAITGLVGGQMLILIVAHYMSVASFAPTLAAMIGLGVGIDYALFVTSRYRQGMDNGLDKREAALQAVRTAGRAVLFAGSTVIIALLGMMVLRIDFFNGLAVAAAVAVLMVMASALVMLPALLSLLGTKALALRMPWRRHVVVKNPEDSKWARYGTLLQKAPILPLLVSVGLVLTLASPALGMRLGFPDDGSQQPAGSSLRTGFDLLEEGFGEGVNGPFFIAVKLPKPHDAEELAKTVKILEEVEGVKSTFPSSNMMLLLKKTDTIYSEDGLITSIIVQPTTSPQSEKTVLLLDRIRDEVAPKVLKETGAVIYVGGSQAVSTDFSSTLQKALPVFLLLVVGLGFIALMLLFHSILIPLTAAVTSLLSFVGALGVTVAVFQNGVGSSLLDVPGTGPIMPFLPIMVFAILFGLSMDYQVFLVSRMKEEWDKTGENKQAIRLGLAGSGKVVVAAASIMTCVFLSFVPTPNDTIKLFGVALASAVLIDAFIVRLVLVPSLMSLLGKANWWIPKWLGKILPKITLE